MSQIYTTRRRAVRDAGKAAAPARETRQETYYGGFSETDGGMGSQLGELMQARMRQHFLDHQNPAAEREADQLSAGLDSARTPEEVKSRLGERLGADFSSVRFHTGSGAVSSAEQMGARAYATGRDVYFGKGGFDPSVAAHELVHTVQQGLVESSTPTVSAPAGEVQMLPKLFKKIGGLFKKGSKAQEAAASQEAVPESALEAGLESAGGGPRMQLASAQAGEAAETITGEEEPVTEAVPESIPEAGLGGAAGGLRMQLASAQVGEAAKTLTETKEKKSSLLSRAWGGIKKGAAYVGGAISGKLNSLKRQHQRAVDDLNHHREDYKAMSRTDRFLWTLKNPLARIMASGSMEDTKARDARAKLLEEKAVALAADVQGDGGYDLGDAAFDPMELMEGPGIATSVERDKREAEAARRGDLPNLEATEPLEEIGAEAGAAGEEESASFFDEPVVGEDDSAIPELLDAASGITQVAGLAGGASGSLSSDPANPEVTASSEEVNEKAALEKARGAKAEGYTGTSSLLQDDVFHGKPKTLASLGSTGVGLGTDNLTNVARARESIPQIESEMQQYLAGAGHTKDDSEYKALEQTLKDQQDVGNLTAGERVFGVSSGLLQMGAAGLEAGGNIMKAHSQRKKGDDAGAATHSFYTMSNIADFGTGLSKVIGYGSAATDMVGPIGQQVIPGLGIASGGMKAIGGGIQLGSALSTKKKMDDRIKAMDEAQKSGAQRTRDQERMYRTFKQASGMAKANAVEGGIKLGSGVLNATGNAMTLGGVTAIAGTIVSGLGTAADLAGGLVVDKMKKGVRADTVNEEIGLDEKIKALMAQDDSITEKEAKHIVLKSMGFSTGKRKEAFQHITMRRAAELYRRANGGDEEAESIVKELGLSKTGSGYSLQGIAEKLGMDSNTPWQEQMKATKESRGHNPFKNKRKAA